MYFIRLFRVAQISQLSLSSALNICVIIIRDFIKIAKITKKKFSQELQIRNISFKTISGHKNNNMICISFIFLSNR